MLTLDVNMAYFCGMKINRIQEVPDFDRICEKFAGKQRHK